VVGARPADRAWRGDPGRLKDAPKRSRRGAVGAEAAPILDPTRAATPGERMAGTEKRLSTELRSVGWRVSGASLAGRHHSLAACLQRTQRLAILAENNKLPQLPYRKTNKTKSS